MELLIDIVLLITGGAGALVALVGNTWDPKQPSLPKRLTPLGRIAVLCLAVSLTLGIVKELRASGREDALEQTAERLKETVVRLEERNAILAKQGQLTLDTLGKHEYLTSVELAIDASHRPEGGRGQGYSTPRRLAEFVSGRDLSGVGVGIMLTADYGPLTVYAFGVEPAEGKEEWHAKLFFDEKGRKNYYETDPVPIDVYTVAGGSRLGQLLVAQLGQRELDHFLVAQASLADVFRRPEYPKDSFDPGFELGTLEVTHLVLLEKPVSAWEFAKQLQTGWPDLSNPDNVLSVPRDFMRQWLVTLRLNGREIENIEVSGGFADPAVAARYQAWEIYPKYVLDGSELLLAPRPQDWEAFASHMNANVRELVFGQRGQEREQHIEDVLPPQILRRLDAVIRTE